MATVVEVVAVDQGRIAGQQKSQEAPYRLHQIGAGHLDDDDGVRIQHSGEHVARGLECAAKEDGNRGDLGRARPCWRRGIAAVIGDEFVVLVQDGPLQPRKPHATASRSTNASCRGPVERASGTQVHSGASQGRRRPPSFDREPAAPRRGVRRTAAWRRTPRCGNGSRPSAPAVPMPVPGPTHCSASSKSRRRR